MDEPTSLDPEILSILLNGNPEPENIYKLEEEALVQAKKYYGDVVTARHIVFVNGYIAGALRFE